MKKFKWCKNRWYHISGMDSRKWRLTTTEPPLNLGDTRLLITGSGGRTSFPESGEHQIFPTWTIALHEEHHDKD